MRRRFLSMALLAGAFVMAGCGSSTTPTRERSAAPPPSSGIPVPTPELPSTVPGEAHEPGAFENRNDRSSALGKLCWGHTEFMHMVTSFAAPMVSGSPLYSNAYVEDATRRDAVLATLSGVGDLTASVADDVPDKVRPFAEYLASESKTLHAAVDALPESADLRSYHSLFFDELGDSEHWPGVRAFVSAAEASPDCDLDA